MLDAELALAGPDGPIRGGPGGPGGAGARGVLGATSGAIPVLEIRHTLVSPRDVATGQASGKRRHAPITVVKEVDRSTPLLLGAWARNAVLTTWKLTAFAADQLGRRRPAYTIELRRALVTEVALTTADAPAFPREAVSFVYEAITWTWLDGTVTANDDWLAPV